MQRARTRLSGRSGSKPAPPLSLLIPGLLVAAATLLPLVYLVIRAWGASGGVLAYMLEPRTLLVLWRTLLLVVSVSLCSLLIALPLAFLTTRTNLWGRRVWFILGVLPLVVPSYVGAYAFVSAFAPGGLMTERFDLFLPVYGFWGALLVLTLFNYPYLLLTLRTGFRGLDPSLEEAARSLGYSAWRSFFSVTLPLLRPAMAAGVLLVALYVLSDFGAVSLLRYNTFTRAIYVQYENSFNRSNAALLGMMLVGLMGLILLFDARLRGRTRIDRLGSGAARKKATVNLGIWQIPALGFLSLVVSLALIAPLGIIVTWLFRGLASEQVLSLGLAPIWNAVSVSLATAVFAVLAAIPVAVLAVRFPGRASALLERLSYVGYALPGIVVALALVFFGARYLPWLYQTEILLIFAYLLLFLPQAVGNLRATLLQVNPHLEEAARSLGRNQLETLMQVTLPLVRSGLVTSAALVFLTTMKELPATLLLRPTEFDTLATRIWSWTGEAFFAQAAPYALVLILVSSLSLWILLSQEQR